MSGVGVFSEPLEVIATTGVVAGQVYVTDAGKPTDPNAIGYKRSAKGPINIYIVDLSEAGSLLLESGTWDGSSFTPDAANVKIATLRTAGDTVDQFVHRRIQGRDTKTGVTGAIRLTTTGGSVEAHIRSDGFFAAVP